jgi:prevent-host-death family protein
MPWNIAQAKQRFSEVVKQAATEPQIIYKRNQPVAAIIGAEDLAKFQEWRRTQSKPRTLADDFDELRALAADDPDPLPDPDRRRAGRDNAFLEAPE